MADPIITKEIIVILCISFSIVGAFCTGAAFLERRPRTKSRHENIRRQKQ